MSPKLKKAKSSEPVRLDLACGQNPKEGFLGVDLWNEKASVVTDLQVFPWPWENDSVDEIHSSHYIEHIPMDYVSHGGQKKDSLFAFFDECWRILKHDSVLTIVCPCARNNRGFQDPTHRRFIVAETFLYFNEDWRKLNRLDHYHTNSNFGLSVGHTMDASTSLLHPEAQARRFNESWNVIHDWVVTLRAIKRKDQA